MSAESPRRGLHKGAQVISPQPVSDRSIIDSVAGIINDIVPQSYTGVPNPDNKESITWARFEYADVSDPILYPDYNEGSGIPPLLLVLGYGTGVQVWLVAASGDATEVLSWRQGIVRTLRILPNPKTDDDHVDSFESKRPMVAICDSAGPGPQFCNVNFISMRTGEQVKSIKFKNPVNDVLANRRSVVVTLSEKIAVFDARTLEDILTVTTCYPSPGPNPNPVALGSRWLAYSEKKLLPARRSSGGSEGEGVQSYTATVLHAAKSLGKGLRGLGETVASSLTGNSVTPITANNVACDVTQPGVITILDLQAAKDDKELDDGTIETVVAHFTAHSDAIVAMTFDLTGALLMTADKRGHDFHVFRIQPHPGGPTLAAVHHLYVLHRGDTTAKVQDMTFSSDARWAAVSTVRGTTHVFPVAPYGGPVGIRTHSTPHVVNRLSRFHRSAGLTADGTRSHSPVSHAEVPLSVYPYSNPRLPPYPHPTVLHPLTQIRQPSTLNHVNNPPQPRPQQRQRLHSEDSGSLPLKICACFAPQRAWLYAQRDSTNKVIKRAVDSLFIMACHGNMIQYDLEPKPAAGVPKEKVCDDTMIELDVEAKGQWPFLRSPGSLEILPPLLSSSPLLGISVMPKSTPRKNSAEDQWLSQVEIVTHAGPHRRLWMGPQFVFKTYNAPSGVAVNLVEAEAVEVGVTGGSRPARSNPVNMPHATTRPLVPVVIDGSGSSYEQSPRFMEAYGDSLENENIGIGGGENQLREDLAEAMLETAAAPHRVPGRRVLVERAGQPVAKVVNPLGTVITVTADEEDITSSQEFDADNTQETPRSLCAEEGPASLSDYEQEGQTIKNLTEICAEMRSTIEPAIGTVSSENIRDVKEKKTLCAEAAKVQSKSEVNFDKADAFRDVPTTLNLCAEAGKIPNSPMTRAKENPWNRRPNSNEKLQERNIATAKYVVNYDEDSVVLMENKATNRKKTGAENVFEEGIIGNRDSDQANTKSSGEVVCQQPQKRATTKSMSSCNSVSKEERRYTVKEQEGSVIIDDAKSRVGIEKSGQSEHFKGTKDKNLRKTTHTAKEQVDTVMIEPAELSQTSLSVVQSENVVQNTASREKSTKKLSKNKCKDVEKYDSCFESIRSSEIKAISKPLDSMRKAQTCLSETPESTAEFQKFKTSLDNEKIESIEDLPVHTGDYAMDLPPLESLPTDDFSFEYHIVEKIGSPSKNDVSPNHSDEDIEHIHSSEVTQTSNDERFQDDTVDIKRESDEQGQMSTGHNETSPKPKRKASKNAISDDDMEHIHTSEILEAVSKRSRTSSRIYGTKLDIDAGSQKVRRISRNIVSSDDDMEHIETIEEPEATSMERDTIETNFESKTIETNIGIVEDTVNKLAASDDDLEHIRTLEVPGTLAKKSDDDLKPAENQGTSKAKLKNRKKMEEIIVIDPNLSEGEGTFTEPVGPRGGWSKSKTPEKDLIEEIDKCLEPNATDSEVRTPRKLKTKGKETMSKKNAVSESIEIIDIDAMQRAELMEVTTDMACHSEQTHEISVTKTRKSKKSRKINSVEANADVLPEAASHGLSKRNLIGTEISPKQKLHVLKTDVSETAQTPVSSWSSIVKKKREHSFEAGEAATVTEDFEHESHVLQEIEVFETNVFTGEQTKEPDLPESEQTLGSRQNKKSRNKSEQAIAVIELKSPFDYMESKITPIITTAPGRKSKSETISETQKVCTETIVESEIHSDQAEGCLQPQPAVRKNKKTKSRTDVSSEKISIVPETTTDTVVVKEAQHDSMPLEEPQPVLRKSKKMKSNVEATSDLSIDTTTVDSCLDTNTQESTQPKTVSRKTKTTRTKEEPVAMQEPKMRPAPSTESEREHSAKPEPEIPEKINQLLPPLAEPDGTFCSPKEASPELESFIPEKKSDSEQETVPGRSSSSDDLNANSVPMDTEEDKVGGNTSAASSAKRGRSKKKKRR